MDENKHCEESQACRSKCCCNPLPFILGIAVALAFGWWVFPGMLYGQKEQPIFFTHKTHVETAGLSCDTCHSFAADGSFTGLPRLDACNSCHAGMDALQTPEPDSAETRRAREAEVDFIKNYVMTGQEVPWIVHQKQPDNVFFSHAAHYKRCFSCHLTMKGDLNLGTPENPQRLCQTCHPSLEELDKQPPVGVNVLTGYSKTTMKMATCENCHAHPGHFYNDGKGRAFANNACFTCHR